ncbi:unnamed protein product [Durusdinium trenchii]|uniref:Pentatricopeptide repeat-containing protein, chloroplastic n=1 Tax=Durusdinium trenchii TaxID=1381693 RepID=A0ABP0NJ03_9DINO
MENEMRSAANFKSVLNTPSRANNWQNALELCVRGHDEADVITYSEVISKAAWPVSLWVLQLARRALRADVISFTQGIFACKAEQWLQALALFDQIQKVALAPSVVSYGAMLRLRGGTLNWSQALVLVGGMRPQHLQPNVVVCNTTVSACGDCWPEALGLLCELRFRGLQSDLITINAVMNAAEKSEAWAAALTLLQTLEHKPNLITSNSAVSAARAAWPCAGLLFEKGRQNRMQDLISYNATLTGSGAAWAQAFDLLAQLQSMLRATVVSYNATITVCEKAAQWLQALHLLSGLQLKGLESTVVTRSAAISACEKGYEWPQALRLLCTTEEVNNVSYAAAISAMEKEAQWEWALQLLFGMEAQGLALSVVALNASISACANSKQWAEALQLMSEAEGRQMELDLITYNATINACEGREALVLLSDLRGTLQLDVVSYTSALMTSERVDWEATLERLREMKSDGIDPDLTACNAAMSSFAKRRKWPQALKLLQELDAVYLQADDISIATAITSVPWYLAQRLLTTSSPSTLRPACSAAVAAAEQAGQVPCIFS